MTWWQAVIGLLGVTLVPLLTYLSGRSSAKNGKQANHTADWDAFTKRLEAWTERQLKEQDDRTEQQLAERDRRIDALADEVAEVRSELSTLMRKYRSAVAYIHRLVRQLQKHVDPDDIETPPEEIVPDL